MSGRVGMQQAAAAAKAAPARRNFPLLRVAVFFSLLVLGFNLLQWLVLTPAAMARLQLLTARLAAWLISLTGLQPTLVQTEIFLGASHWEVTPECTALSAVYVFVSFVLVYPATLKAKIQGVLIGIPLLLTANLGRLLALAWAETLIPGQVAFFHDYLWQVLFLLLVVVMWLGWIELWVKDD